MRRATERRVAEGDTVMRIDEASVTLFRWDDIAPAQYGTGNPAASGSELGLLELRTDAGIRGRAFLGASFRTARLDMEGLVRHLLPLLRGENPLERERLFARMHGMRRAATPRAIGACDVALWEIAGQAAGLPLHALMGGFRRKVPACASSSTSWPRTRSASSSMACAARRASPPFASREAIAESLYYAWSKEIFEAGKRRPASDTARAASTDEVKELRSEACDLKEVVAERGTRVAPAEERNDRGWGRSHIRYPAAEKARCAAVPHPRRHLGDPAARRRAACWKDRAASRSRDPRYSSTTVVLARISSIPAPRRRPVRPIHA